MGSWKNQKIEQNTYRMSQMKAVKSSSPNDKFNSGFEDPSLGGIAMGVFMKTDIMQSNVKNQPTNSFYEMDKMWLVMLDGEYSTDMTIIQFNVN